MKKSCRFEKLKLRDPTDVEIKLTLNWAQIQRLRLIDVLLDHCGYVNRIVLMDYYGISQPQASTDIKYYTKIAPNNIRYDSSRKAYVKTDTFERVWD